jgi:hypothetical protein
VPKHRRKPHIQLTERLSSAAKCHEMETINFGLRDERILSGSEVMKSNRAKINAFNLFMEFLMSGMETEILNDFLNVS